MPRLPNFIYIGPDKAGSSWLHEVLIRHEQVFMPDAKDLYFFDRYYDRGVSWYATQFKDAGPGHQSSVRCARTTSSTRRQRAASRSRSVTAFA